MKTFVLPGAIVLSVAAAAVANAQPVGECAGVVQEFNDVASATAGYATSHREARL
jgi:hypothetical protein